MTNPAEYPHQLALQAYEDDEQAHILSQQVITLHYDEHSHILRGEFAGQHVDDIRQRTLLGHFAAGREVKTETGICWPWWRLWKPTRYVRIVVG